MFGGGYLRYAIVFAALFAQLRAASPYTLSADGLTVNDSVNNITWLADLNLPASNRFSLPPCNSGTSPCANVTGSMNYASAAAWVAALNAANYLGHSNWQLPTTPVNDAACGKTGPGGVNFGFGCTLGALDTLYNTLGLKSPNTAVPIPANATGPFSNIQPYLYWSQSTPNQNQGNSTFSFLTGWQGTNTLPNFLYVWPMIAGKIAGAPAASGMSLQASADGKTVYDPETNVTWAANANLAASNPFGLPVCTSPTAPSLCVAQDGAMTYASAAQFVTNMNASAYLGQTNWQVPTIDASCSNNGCGGAQNPMGNLFYNQLGLSPGASAVAVPNITVDAFHNLQPYLYWTCGGAAVQNACTSAQPEQNQEWSYSFGSGFQGTDILPNSLFVTAYFVGSRTASSGPVIAEVANAEQESPVIAPNTWIEIKGANLAAKSRPWQSSDFLGNQMPTQLDGVSVTVNGRAAYIYYISSTQIDALTPPQTIAGPVQVVVSSNGVSSTPFIAQSQTLSPSFFVFNGGPYVAAVHPGGGLVGPASLYPASTTPAASNEVIMIYANGFGQTSQAVVAGLNSQGGTLSPLPVVTIGGLNAPVQYAGLAQPGEFQFNVQIPKGLGNGDQAIVATFNGASTPAGTLITVQK